MAKFKKALMIGMSIMLMGTFVACDFSKSSDEREGREKILEVVVFNGGYGYKWMEDVADYYMENVNQDTYVDVKQTVLNTEE